ncbi:MAG TPA: TetR/AcrR family transcriptional regulator [Acidimicrobiia bacterium]|nr:TetR/AcrR family transcriptional regulator [Acidimicrobiia bacterium]
MTVHGADARREQIMQAVVDLTVGGGLPAATFRTIAERAGVSVRLVQYYFGDKDRLLADTLARVGRSAADRITAALDAIDSDSPRAVIETICEQFLPLDDERRRAMLVFIAFRTAALTDATLASSQTLGLADSLIATFETQLQAATPERRSEDLHSEAILLAAGLTGLANMMLADELSSEEARQHLRYALDRAM